jgi:hypothetical protein
LQTLKSLFISGQRFFSDHLQKNGKEKESKAIKSKEEHKETQVI